jgi:hypothetical protein
MCPVCFSSVAWLITGGVSVLGATAGGVAIVGDRRIATGISKIWKLRTCAPLPSGLVFRGLKTNVESENKGEIRWQQANRETRNTGKGISR